MLRANCGKKKFEQFFHLIQKRSQNNNWNGFSGEIRYVRVTAVMVISILLRVFGDFGSICATLSTAFE